MFKLQTNPRLPSKLEGRTLQQIYVSAPRPDAQVAVSLCCDTLKFAFFCMGHTVVNGKTGGLYATAQPQSPTEHLSWILHDPSRVHVRAARNSKTNRGRGTGVSHYMLYTCAVARCVARPGPAVKCWSEEFGWGGPVVW